MVAAASILVASELIQYPVAQRASPDRDILNPSFLSLTAAPILSRKDPLTPRRKEIVILQAKGYSNPEVAKRLGISVKTVDTIAYNIMKKLDLHDRASLIMWAIREGLVDPASISKVMSSRCAS